VKSDFIKPGTGTGERCRMAWADKRGTGKRALGTNTISTKLHEKPHNPQSKSVQRGKDTP